MTNLFEVLSSELSAGATLWNCPPLTEDSHENPTVSGSKLNTAAHLDSIEKAAYEEGFARGHAEGYAHGNREAQAVAARISLLLEHMSRPLKDLNAEVEHALIRLVVDTARRLVNQAIELDPQLVNGVVNEAVASVATTTREMKIFLHPDDLSVLKNNLSLTTDATWKLVADATLRRGDCRVVTESSQIDARMDTRQTNIERALLGEDA
ncbi:MAG: FliH/SctL family protein [Pseudomonadota bacterium]